VYKNILRTSAMFSGENMETSDNHSIFGSFSGLIIKPLHPGSRIMPVRKSACRNEPTGALYGK
jgi:hypothetical protein